MIESFYSGRAGLAAHEKSMEVVSNNISNVNTTSYKTKTQTFGSLLRMSEVRPETPNSGNLLAGAGSNISTVSKNMSGGNYNATEKNTDFFINGSGYFKLRDAQGNIYYTRDGSFHKEITQNGTILAASNGMSVLSANDNPVRIDNNGVPGDPAIYNFSNASGLFSEGENLYTTSNTSGNPQLSDEVAVSGGLEGSNVDLSEEMVNMITSQRGLQLNSRLVQTADSIESMINELNR